MTSASSLNAALAVALAFAAVAASASALPLPTGLPFAIPGDLVSLDIAFVETLPPGTPRAVNVTVTFCAAESALLAAPREVAVKAADPPPWLSFTFEPSTFTFAVVKPGECDEAMGLARLNATREAPGFDIVNVTVQATDAATGQSYGSVGYVFRVGFSGDFSVSPRASRLAPTVGEPTPLAFTVENLGNADTTFMVQSAGSREDVGVVVPQPLRIAPGERGSWRVNFVVPPQTGTDVRSVQLLVTSHATLDHTALGKSAVLTVELDPQPSTASFGLPAPGLVGALSAIGLAFALAFAARRR